MQIILFMQVCMSYSAKIYIQQVIYTVKLESFQTEEKLATPYTFYLILRQKQVFRCLIKRTFLEEKFKESVVVKLCFTQAKLPFNFDQDRHNARTLSYR